VDLCRLLVEHVGCGTDFGRVELRDLERDSARGEDLLDHWVARVVTENGQGEAQFSSPPRGHHVGFAAVSICLLLV
jgi:hypothetical protein